MSVVTAGVYAITHRATGRRYIGSSLSIERRWNSHVANLNRNKHTCPELNQAWMENGQAGFEFSILAVETDRQKRLELELRLLRQEANPFNVAIRMLTGPNPGYKHTPEAIEKIRLAMVGKPKSAEHRAKLSKWRSGRKFPAHAAALRGRQPTEETRRKISLAHIGREKSPETRAKLSASLKGRVFTPEWKAKLSAGRRGISRARYYGAKHDFFELIESVA